MRTRAAHGVVVGLLVLVLTGCTAEPVPAPSPPAPSPTADPPASAAPLPAFTVVREPDGFTRAAHDPGGPGWQQLMTHDDGCVVESRGAEHEGEVVDDTRVASIELLEQLAAADDAVTGPVTDVSVPLGASLGPLSSATMTFVTADWVRRRGELGIAVRGIGRVVAVTSFEGRDVVRSLELRVVCPADAVPEPLWEAVVAELRPHYIRLTPDGTW